ncbi:MAG: hypothetical protein ACYTGQ_01825 [Planctomycetota bacterium]|jgi:hypothetical protein
MDTPHALRTVPILFILLAVIFPGAAQETFDTLSPAPAPPAFDFTAHRAAQLEADVATQLERLTLAEGDSARAIRAAVSYRLAARKLLIAGHDATQKTPPQGAVAILYGHALADAADHVTNLFSQLPVLSQTLGNPQRHPTEEQLHQLTQLRGAVERFNQLTEGDQPRLAGTDPDQVDAYLTALLEPVAAMHRAMGGDEPRDTWLASTDGDSTAGPLSQSDIQRFARWAAGATLPDKTRKPLLAIADMLRRGWATPGLRPRVAPVARLALRSIAPADALPHGRAFGADATLAFNNQLHTAVMLIAEPRMRHAASQRLDELGRDLELGKRLTELDDLGMPTEDLIEAFTTAQGMIEKGRDIRAARALIELLAEAAPVMLEYRARLTDSLPPDLNSASLKLRSEYQRAEIDFLRRVRQLIEYPRQVHDLETRHTLNLMLEAIDRLNHVHDIPAVIDRLKRFKPSPTGGLYQQLARTAGRLLEPEYRVIAGQLLKQLHEEVERFDPLPHENLLRDPTSAVEQLTGGQTLLLVEQINQLRQGWATAWARGLDPAANTQRLDHLTQLLRAIHLVVENRKQPDAAQRLARWAAWQVPHAPGAAHRNTDQLAKRITDTAGYAAVGDWLNFEAAGARLREHLPLPRLIQHLHTRLAPETAAPSTDPITDLLGRTLYRPHAQAYGANHRQALAHVANYLIEARHARANDDKAQTDALIEYAAKRASGLLKELE